MLGFPAQSMQTRNPGQRGRPPHIVLVTLGLVVIKPRQVLRCVPTLRRILLSLVPHCLIYPPQQPHREVWGPHISTLEMTKPRLGRLGLSPICFLLLSSPNAVPRSQGYDSLAGGGGAWRGSADNSRTPISSSRVLLSGGPVELCFEVARRKSSESILFQQIPMS